MLGFDFATTEKHRKLWHHSLSPDHTPTLMLEDSPAAHERARNFTLFSLRCWFTSGSVARQCDNLLCASSCLNKHRMPQPTIVEEFHTSWSQASVKL